MYSNNQNYVTIARNCMRKSRTIEAIDALKACELTNFNRNLLSGFETELSNLNTSKFRGSVSYSDATLRENDINSRLLDFISSTETSFTQDAAKPENVVHINGNNNTVISGYNTPAMPQITQYHAGAGDNIAGNKVVQPENNATFPKKELFDISKNRIHSDAAKQAKDCLTEFNEYNNEKEYDATFDHMNIELHKLLKKANGIIKFFTNKTAKASTSKVTDWNTRLAGLPTKVVLKAVYEELTAYGYDNPFIEKMIAPKGVCTDTHRNNAANQMQDWIKKNLNLFS